MGDSCRALEPVACGNVIGSNGLLATARVSLRRGSSSATLRVGDAAASADTRIKSEKNLHN